MIKIFAIEPHSNYQGDNPRMSGVDFVRIVQPMKYLNKVDGFKVTLWNNKLKTDLNWDKVTKTHDIIFTSYNANAWAFAAMGMFARKNDCKIVMDVDDALWDILPDNSAYEDFKPGSEALHAVTSMLREVDVVTTTNSYLKNIMAHRCNLDFGKIKVIPNYIDLKFYNHRPKFKDTHDIQISHFGSTTHSISLQEVALIEAMEQLMIDFPNLSFKTVGAFLPRLKEKFGQRYNTGLGSQDLVNWVKTKMPPLLDETDIFIAPLTENVYNKAKSPIKYLEISSAKKPGVYQNIRQYQEVMIPGVNGKLASHKNDWYLAIKTLIENKELRKSIGEKAFENVKKNYTIQGNIDRVIDVFEKIV